MQLVGNYQRWAALARAYQKDRIPHTLLISGPPHIGKSVLVLRYAQLLLCQQVRDDADGLPAPCGTCRACHQVEVGTYPDYQVFAPIVSEAAEKDWVIAPEVLDSSVLTIEIARKFTEESLRKPISSERKVLVMKQVDRLTIPAQNALLKTFEEPPSGTFIVLTTENARKLRETILSRCWHLPLAPAPEAEIAEWLRAELPDAGAAHVREALRASGGRPGAARRELERLEEGGGTGEQRSRFQVASELLARLESAAPVAALRFTEEALALSKEWWAQDAGEEGELKKGAAKASRAAAARFLDELMAAARSRWAGEPQETATGMAQLDLMRKTRQYILRNANLNLALDVMFSRLIALHPARGASGPAASTHGRVRI